MTRAPAPFPPDLGDVLNEVLRGVVDVGGEGDGEEALCGRRQQRRLPDPRFETAQHRRSAQLQQRRALEEGGTCGIWVRPCCQRKTKLCEGQQVGSSEKTSTI